MKKLSLSVLYLIIGLFLSTQTISAQTSVFTYQGKLTDGSAAANGLYDFKFELYKDLTANDIVGTVSLNGVQVTNGIFTVQLDFGSEVFRDGTDRFLDISVKLLSGSTYTRLAPRQKLASVPFATRSLIAQTADFAVNAQNAQNSNSLGGLTSNNFLLVNGDGSQLTNVIGAIRWHEISANIQAVSNKGYIVNSGNEIEISLPTNPQVGDTVRVVHSGGNGNFFIKLNSGQTVSRVDDGSNLNWTPNASNLVWTDIASSTDGTKLIAAGRDSNTGIGHIFSSIDSGSTWVLRFSDSGDFQSLASSADGAKLVAVKRSGKIFTSTDSGITWQLRTTLPSGNSVASSADGTKLVVAPLAGNIFTSTDSGITWVQRDNSGNRGWNSVASSADGNKLIAAAFDTGGLTEQVYISNDSGQTWTPTLHPFVSWIFVASSADGTRLMAVSNRIYTSSDGGITWTPREFERTWRAGVAMSANGKILMASYQNTLGNFLMTSSDYGATWKQQDTNRLWNGFACSADGAKQFAAADFIYVKPSNTLPVGLRGSGAIELIYVGNGKFSILSSSGSIAYF